MRWKKILLGVIAVIIVIGVSGGIFYYKYKIKQQLIQVGLQEEQKKVNEQLDQLESLRQQYNANPPTPLEIKEQLNELNKLREKAGSGTSAIGIFPIQLAPQQIQQQFDELEKLKNQ